MRSAADGAASGANDAADAGVDDRGPAISDASPDTASSSAAPPRPTRRHLLTATGAALAGGTLGWAGALASSRRGGEEAQAAPTPDTDPEAGPAPTGADLRAGITWPVVPQRHTAVAVITLERRSAQHVIELARAASASAGAHPADAGDVTVLTALGIRHARSLMPERCGRAEGLPGFDSDAPAIVRGGDLLVTAASETAAGASDALAGALKPLGAHRVLWAQKGYRDAPTPAGTTRSGIGFIDGIVNPRTEVELRAGVWAGEAKRDTFLVVRRMLVARSFGSLGVPEQEAAVGRSRDTGAPLSGGGPLDDIDLFAKRDDGRTLIPAGAHARRAHPANIGRALMLRRSYSFDADDGSGLLFVAALADAETFVLTQRRLDAHDDLLRHTTTTAGDCFFVPEELSERTM
ncbi:Dyp-type peroxidase [Microbacterium sp. No. 7]|uniref:Dyp-type peroxidase n=1 Tax=Microbacterium sp. No. 7 TaxID=1714373 RepID=UPI0006D09563|nr:Dyp-type peroxidase [Microbacterium sp. No. 7]ALJ21358.1 hypothetical protein AOA12_16190 [Microbacterium sp. No. 7]